jgi:soluble lytic murein transglycosylase-like protein
MMRKKLILTVLLMLPISVSAQKEQFDWTPVMDAIIRVESKGDPKAFNKNGNCAGILQITPGLVKQCNEWLKAKKSKKRYTLADRYDVKKSKEIFVMVQSYYNKSNNVEKAIRIWNGGPGYTIKGTNGYLKKVMKYYKEKGAE